LPEQWAQSSDLTKLCAFNREIVCSLIYNKNLACSEGTGLDCCIMIATTGDYDMAIITLGRLYFMLSCPIYVVHMTCR
jgi:hypothetical protein